MGTIHLITGGQRSGKSLYAEKCALEKSNCPIYLATSKHWDEEHSRRIKIHQDRRDNQWCTVEEPVAISNHDFEGKIVLLDCVTLWLTNLFDENKFDQQKSIKKAKELIDKICLKDTHFIIVTNEIGMGVIPMEASTRKFVDAQGIVNQYIADKASRVTLMISGIPMDAKNENNQ